MRPPARQAAPARSRCREGGRSRGVAQKGAESAASTALNAFQNRVAPLGSSPCQPHQGESFFVDGVPFTKEKIRRLKIIRESDFFASEFSQIHHDVRTNRGRELEAAVSTYDTRLSALYLETNEDVTSQVLKAFNSEVKPKLMDYIPKRAELVSAALQVFLQALKALSD